jgi:serine/threonine-protein kinase
MESALADPLIGRMLDQRYLVRSRVAHGGMATVYLATDTRLDREVALKVMHAELARDADFVTRFIGEAKSVARLSHPNIVAVFDQGSDGQFLYLSMEYVPGRTLRSLLSERGWFPYAEAMAVMDPILSGLAAAHRAGIVHRDVKPENVLVSADGRVKVVDFGLARAQSATSRHTKAGQVIGTVAYIAPEQVKGGVTDFHTDVYAAGVMLFEMLTGRQPHAGETALQVAYKHVNEDVPPPSAFVPGLPPAVDQLVRAATSRNPQLRPANADMFLSAIRSLRGIPANTAPRRRPVSGTGTLPRPVLPGGSDGPDGPVGPVGPGGPSGPGGSGGTNVTAVSETAPGAFREPGFNTTAVADFAMHDGATGVYDGFGGFGGAPGYPAGAGYPRQREPFLSTWLFSKRLGTVAVCGVVVLAAGLGGWWFTSGRYAPLPQVTGVSEARALQMLRADGFQGTESGQPVIDDNVPKGDVISASPSGRAPKGSTIELTVSAGPKMIKVPPVVGQTSVAAAQAVLRKAGLRVAAQPKQVASASLPVGAVAGTTPAAGTPWPQTSAVTVDVVAGTPMPTLTGQNISDVQSWAGQNNITLNVTQVANSAAAGTVISQSVPANSPVAPGATVNVQVSSGPPQVTVPDVTGQSVNQATQTLQQAGFKVSVQQIGFGGGKGNGGGKVIAENPSGQAAQGSTITLYSF